MEIAQPGETVLPGLADVDAAELDRELEDAELLLISHELAERLAANGEAPADLKSSFQLPFDSVFFEIDPALSLPEEHGEGVRGIFVSKPRKRYRVRAWFDERRPTVKPRYDFTFTPGETLPGPEKRIIDLLYWLVGYINSPNLLAIRHNRRHEMIKRYLDTGRPAPSSYYMFEPAPEPRKPRMRRRPGEPKPRTTSVHGHFRRAHWHRLPSTPRLAWYPTTWVRDYKRRLGVES
jgi:hypothetical protein